MGLVINQKDIDLLNKVAKRERAPIYVVGDITNDQRFVFENHKTGQNPMDWNLSHMFGSSPKTVLTDNRKESKFKEVEFDNTKLQEYLNAVLQLEAVACKDWLTNKVDRCVTGRVAKQQCAGPLQLPLNNLGVMAMDYRGHKGIATSIGHSPLSALVDPVAGSQASIAEALTNIIWAPIEQGLKGISLSANWMWPAKQEGENSRLYDAVKGISDFACELGINVPTGKDSLSMTQKYKDGVVYSPGTVIISAVGEVSNLKQVVEPVIQNVPDSTLIYIDFSGNDFKLGGSSFAQIVNRLGTSAPRIVDSNVFADAFLAVQNLVKEGLILSGHDISAGGIITTLLEMTFATNEIGITADLSALNAKSDIELLFSEKSGIVFQVANQNLDKVNTTLQSVSSRVHFIGTINQNREVRITTSNQHYILDANSLRDVWFKTSYLLDKKQSTEPLATERFKNYKKHNISYTFPEGFTGTYNALCLDPNRKTGNGPKAAIIREKGVNGDREMAYAMHLAGFDVKDVHMTDLISGEEDLSNVNMIAFVGGFSNSDVLGSAKGWAGAFLYNDKAKQALDNFYARPDTLSLGICNGCQLMGELGLVYPEHENHPKLLHNESGKFESGFVAIDIPKNDSVMLGSLSGTRLGIWAAHGEGRFNLPLAEENYHIIGKYGFESYPANPNGSDYNVAGIASKDGRHLAIMPHFERSIFPWNWGYYPADKKMEDLSPWIIAFKNAREWVETNS
jgi:phosphoribosylformylglycinamidine synthase